MSVFIMEEVDREIFELFCRYKYFNNKTTNKLMTQTYVNSVFCILDGRPEDVLNFTAKLSKLKHKGNGTSTGLTTQDISSLRKSTPFTHDEIVYLLKRYSSFDSSPGGSIGISYLECSQMPEFAANPFALAFIESLKDSNSTKIHPRQFLTICSIFSPRTEPSEKKEKLFKLFDKEGKNILRHDHMFRLFKTMFGNALSDDHILALTFRALSSPSLANEGEITLAEFSKMVTDCEINDKFTVEFLPN